MITICLATFSTCIWYYTDYCYTYVVRHIMSAHINKNIISGYMASRKIWEESLNRLE